MGKISTCGTRDLINVNQSWPLHRGLLLFGPHKRRFAIASEEMTKPYRDRPVFDCILSTEEASWLSGYVRWPN